MIEPTCVFFNPLQKAVWVGMGGQESSWFIRTISCFPAKCGENGASMVSLSERLCPVEFYFVLSKRPDSQGRGQDERLQDPWCWLVALLKQGRPGAGFPESGLSQTGSAEWLIPPVLRQCLLLSLCRKAHCPCLSGTAWCPGTQEPSVILPGKSGANWGSWSPYILDFLHFSFLLAFSNTAKQGAFQTPAPPGVADFMLVDLRSLVEQKGPFLKG